MLTLTPLESPPLFRTVPYSRFLDLYLFNHLKFCSWNSLVEILGLDPGVNPTDITAFVTGLTFMMDGSFTGTMQPLVAEVAVPGPVVGAGLPGLIFAWGGLLAWRRRHRQKESSSGT
jgi:hypothetical protein